MHVDRSLPDLVEEVRRELSSEFKRDSLIASTARQVGRPGGDPSHRG